MPKEMAIYHQFHLKSESGKKSIERWEQVCHDLFAAKLAPQINDLDWGMSDHELPEHVFEFL